MKTLVYDKSTRSFSALDLNKGKLQKLGQFMKNNKSRLNDLFNYLGLDLTVSKILSGDARIIPVGYKAAINLFYMVEDAITNLKEVLKYINDYLDSNKLGKLHSIAVDPRSKWLMVIVSDHPDTISWEEVTPGRYSNNGVDFFPKEHLVLFQIKSPVMLVPLNLSALRTKDYNSSEFTNIEQWSVADWISTFKREDLFNTNYQ